MAEQELIAQGAEAKIYKRGGSLVKERFAKNYRISELDISLRESRTKREGVILKKIPQYSPALIRVDKTSLELAFIEGTIMKDALDEKPSLAEQIGVILAELHKQDIIHGDVTTSNMILTPEQKVVFIDFGLSSISKRIEDKAVDIHLFRQALESKHALIWENAFIHFLAGYRETNPDSEEIFERLAIVESRGRNKQKF